MARIITAIVLFFVLLPYPDMATASHTVPQKKRVLVLYGQEKGMSAQDLIEKGMRETLRNSPAFDVQLYFEYLDLTRFDSPDYAKGLAGFLQRKYATRQPDLIITVFPTAYDFLIHPGYRLFEGVPVVACTMPPERAGELSQTSRLGQATGIIVVNTSEEVIRTALRLKPATRRVALVAGDSALDAYVKQFVMQGLQPVSGQLELIELTGLSIDETLKRVATLPQDTLILYASITKDKTGRTFTPDEAFGLVSQAANAPVFGFFDTHLGHGTVGGRLTSFDQQGKMAARLAMRILSGVSPRNITPERDVTINAFDWRELQRWNIPESLVPPGATILYRQPTLWEEHRWQIVGIAAVICLQSSLIALLVIMNSKRRKAEALIQEQKDQLAHVMRVSMMGELSASLAHELKQPLAAIRTNAQTALRHPDSSTPDLAEFRAILTDIVADNRRADEVIRRLRDFFSTRKSRCNDIDMNRLIREVVALVATEIRQSGIVLDLHLPPDMPAVGGDPVQLQQVILNLVMNALESFREGTPVEERITISTAMGAGENLLVTISDTGSGLGGRDPESLFTPFATTKPEGMGMGLTLSRSIVEAHGGALRAFPNNGAGATFLVTLPITARKQDDRQS